ncbi:hypothetical protein L7F22_043878 [Adiantum nelumboides]|nr:hypothetical protein [Adiantum nelumboides]
MASVNHSRSSSSSNKLDLTNIKSYSPQWSHTLRLSLAIAVQYACHRCLERAIGTHQLLYPYETIAPIGSIRRTYKGEHVNVPQEDDAGLVSRDEDGNVQGQLQGLARSEQIRQDREMVEAWREYTNKFLMATCQHLGIAAEMLPPGSPTLEDILSVSRGRPNDSNHKAMQTEFEMGTSHANPYREGTGEREDEVKEEEKVEKAESKNAGKEEEVKEHVIDKKSATAVEPEAANIERQGGILSNDSTQEIEIVNELLLIALGMGQHRAEDGSTTLFEQEAVFGDTSVELSYDSKKEGIQEDPIAEKEDADSQAPSDFGKKTLNFFRSGVSSIGKAGKSAMDRKDGKQKGPVKPNEICHYDARARAIIFVAVTAMDVGGGRVYQAEKVIAQTIYFIMTEGRNVSKEEGKGDPIEEGKRNNWMNTASQEAVEKEKSKINWAKWAAMGAGAAVGGALIGVTGGLAAPLVAPALVGLTGISFLATTGGIMMMATLLGVGGAGLAGFRVKNRLRGIEYFEFNEVNTTAKEAGVTIPSLHATICCPGLQLEEHKQGQAFDQVFYQTPDARDAYIIHTEEEMMKRAGEGLKGYVLQAVLKSGGQRVGTEVLKHTALAGIAALTLPLTVYAAASTALDGVFVQAKSRSYRAGLILADVLRDEVQGHRPVTLIGTSLGCVTILTALGELAKQPGENGHLVDSVFLIGAPFSPSPAVLRRARSVVSRRFVTAFSSRDMVCSIAAWLGSGISLEEVKNGQMPRIVGSSAMLGVPGVENVDVSDLVNSHFDLNDGKTLEKVFQRCRIKSE